MAMVGTTTTRPLMIPRRALTAANEEGTALAALR